MKNFLNRYKIFIAWSAVALWMILIFCFSAQDASQSSDTSGTFARFLARLVNSNFDSLNNTDQTLLLSKCQFAVRKAAHFSVYGFLGILTFTAVRISKFRFCYIAAPLICLAYASSDELHQYFVPGRSCELRDVCIDFSGSLCGMLAVIIVTVLLKKAKAGKN